MGHEEDEMGGAASNGYIHGAVLDEICPRTCITFVLGDVSRRREVIKRIADLSDGPPLPVGLAVVSSECVSSNEML